MAQLQSLSVDTCFHFTKEIFQAPLPTGDFSGLLKKADLQTSTVTAPHLLGCDDLIAEFKPLLNMA